MKTPLMQSAPGPETIIDGKAYLYFGGTGYLGLASHPEVIEAGCAALRRFGSHSSTVRGFATHPPVQDVEALAAEFFGRRGAFYFASGYMANSVMVSALADEIDTVVIDEGAHYSAKEAALLARKPMKTFRHGDSNDLERVAHEAGRMLVIADAVSPATGALLPMMDHLSVIRDCAPGILLLDDAHGFGVLGEHGRGAIEGAGLWELANTEQRWDGVRICVAGTLAKAFGGYGGIIPGERDLIEKVTVFGNLYKGSSAPPSCVAASTAKALEIAIREPSLRARVRENAKYLRSGLSRIGLRVPPGDTAHFGFSVGKGQQNRDVSEMLKGRGIILPYVASYAAVPPGGILRAAVFANHTRRDIDHLVSTIWSCI